MSLRRFDPTRSMTSKLAIVAALLLTPSAASAQGHAAAGHAGAAGMNAAAVSGHHNGYLEPSMHHNREYPYWVEPGVWGGYLPGYYNNGSIGYGSTGMSPMDQEMLRQAQLSEIQSRTQMNQMQMIQSYQQANLAQLQAMKLASGRGLETTPFDESTSAPVLGLTGFVALDRVAWPSFKTTDRGLIARADEAGKLLIEVHKQALTQGFAEGRLVSDAKAKLRDLTDTARKSTKINKVARESLNQFIGEVDKALDRSLRRPDADAGAGARGRSEQAGRRIAANP